MIEGLVTKKHFLLVGREFGWLKAIKLLLSKEKTALQLLVS